MTVVLAVDPGKVTGYACWSEGKLMAAGQADYMEWLVWAEAAIPTYAPWGMQVVAERYTIGTQTMNKGTDAHWAIGTNAMLDFWCVKAGVPFKLQAPSEAKGFCTDAKLKRLGWFEATKGGHRNDACRHLVVYLVGSGLLDLRTLAP